jgi:ABC-type multidrug transport system fused ATPase/permease subunit
MKFVRDEELKAGITGLQSYRRLLASLPLFLKLLPLSLVLIVLGSISPSVYRWYAGLLAEGSSRATVGGLALLAGLAALSRILAWACFEISGIWSAQAIHARMSLGLARTRTTFFDENPSGRLINRLVRDYDEVRSTAIIFVGDVLHASTELLSVAILAWFVSPWAAVMVFPLLGLFAWMQWQRSGMLAHSRGLSAMAVSRVLDRKSDLVEGREIFLLYGRAGRLLARMGAAYREYVRASALNFLVETWASFWIRASAEVFSLIVLLSLAMLLHQGRIAVTLAGVIVSALFGVRGSIGWLDHASSLLARSVPHIRRVFEFVDLPREEDEERETPPKTRATAAARPGDIRFEKYTMSYRADSPIILDGLDLTIPLGRKTALIGRTGSGKSSIMQALFRMVHVRSGELTIGGRSVFECDMDSLRALFGVVPQAPYLFAGDLRSNLDRTGTLPGEALERGMRAVGLDFPLDHPVLEGGQNLSVGERQLACLARILAADRPYVLMDEATSGLDPETDARIHRVLSTALSGRTVLTIAHRRESLGSYDHVVELSQGKVIWQGRPSEAGFAGGAV